MFPGFSGFQKIIKKIKKISKIMKCENVREHFDISGYIWGTFGESVPKKADIFLKVPENRNMLKSKKGVAFKAACPPLKKFGK
jgi:hypothetical protein